MGQQIGIAAAHDKELDYLRGELAELKRRDPATGLYNRPAFRTDLEKYLKAAKESGSGYHLILMDVDNLKCVNEEFGPAIGDDFIACVGKLVFELGESKAYRSGGDQFALILEAGEEKAPYVIALSQAVREGVEDISKQMGANVTISQGIVPSNINFQSGELWRRKAKDALVKAKEKKNRGIYLGISR